MNNVEEKGSEKSNRVKQSKIVDINVYMNSADYKSRLHTTKAGEIRTKHMNNKPQGPETIHERFIRFQERLACVCVSLKKSI